MRQLGGSIPVEQIRRWKFDANQRLLGDTIGISDPQWHSPSLLPGWTRAHVATHLARNADTMREITRAERDGTPPAIPTAEERFVALERGAERSGLELQIDLDTTAGRLSQAWDEVTDWHRPIHFEARIVPMALLPLARLHEVCVHHLDLACGFEADRIDPQAGEWLLAWVYRRQTINWQGAPVEIVASSGQRGILGDSPDPVRLEGTDAALWAWLSGRLAPQLLSPDAFAVPLLS